MPIIYTPTLRRQKQVFEAGLLQLMQLRRIPANLTIDQYTFPIYNLTARDVLSNANLSTAARLLGYRYFAHGDSPEAVVAGDVDASSTRVTALSYGSSVQKTLVAKKGLDEQPDLEDPVASNYEPRLLRIPGLYVEAFWLKPLSAGGQADLIVPYHTLIEDLDPAKPISVQDFFDKVSPLAEQALKEGDAPRTEPKQVTAPLPSAKKARTSSLH